MGRLTEAFYGGGRRSAGGRKYSHSRTFIDSKGVKQKGFQEISGALDNMMRYASKGFLKDLRFVGRQIRGKYRSEVRGAFTMRTGTLVRNIGYAVNVGAGSLIVGPRRKAFYAYMLLYGTKTKDGRQRIKPTPFLDSVGAHAETLAATALADGLAVSWGGK